MYKGSPNLKLDKLPEVTIALAIVLTALVVTALSILFWLPFVYCKVVKKDYTLKWFHFFYGPLLWRRAAPAENPDNVAFVPDYRIMREQDTAGAQQDAGVTPSGTIAENVVEKRRPFNSNASQSELCSTSLRPYCTRLSSEITCPVPR